MPPTKTMTLSPRHCLTDPDTQAVLKAYVRACMPGDEVVPTDEDTREMKRKVDALVKDMGQEKMHMILLDHDLYPAFKKVVGDVANEYAQGGAVLVFITENIGGALNAGTTPKSAEWFFLRFLERLGDDRCVVLDLSLMGMDDAAHAPEALAELFRVSDSVVFVMMNDCVYAGSQQPEHMRQLIRWIGEATPKATPTKIAVHLAIAFVAKAGKDVLDAMCNDITGGVVSAAKLTYARVMLHDNGTYVIPGRGLMQGKVPDTIKPPDLAKGLKEILGTEPYRSKNVLERIESFVLRSRP